MDAAYTLLQDLLRGDTLTVFNNKQATPKEQMVDNLEHFLNAVTVQWIARAVKLNNYFTEFPMPMGGKARKLE
eukprot:3090098-Ditylum_brightwellii.AAC.1